MLCFLFHSDQNIFNSLINFSVAPISYLEAYFFVSKCLLMLSCLTPLRPKNVLSMTWILLSLLRFCFMVQNMVCLVKYACVFCCCCVKGSININQVRLLGNVPMLNILPDFLPTCSAHYWVRGVKISTAVVIMKWPSLSVIIFFALKSVLSDNNVDIPTFFPFLTSLLLTYLSLYLKGGFL